MTTSHSDIKDALLNANHIAIAAHVRPDGDAIGSVLGLGLVLRAAGKQVTLLSEKPISHRFHFLPQSNSIIQKYPANVDFFVAVDCAAQDRLGLHQKYAVDLNIDHHITNTLFGRYNIVPTQAASTTEILAELIETWGLPLTADAANALLCGLITDTLGFSVKSTTAHTLAIAQKLIAAGADLSTVYRQGLSLQSLAAIRVWGIAFDRIRQQDGLLWTSLPLAEKYKVGYKTRDDADVINILRTIEGADVYMIFVEKSANETKVSWRSEWVNIATVALQFGGGGHAAAAGATIYRPLKEAEAEAVAATQKLLYEVRAEARASQPAAAHAHTDVVSTTDMH